MNYYDSLNKVIDTIEKELTNEIDYNKLAKIVGISSYSLQRTFSFLTGITLTEYIRKRRLSKAAEDIKRTDEKIIDIALKYQYDSPVSFSNAFKKMHGISPLNARKNNASLKNFEKIQFMPATEPIEEFKYRIVEMEEQEFYGVTTGVILQNDSKSIRDLYDETRKNGTMNFLIENSNQKELYYGISEEIIKNDIYTDKMKYYIARKNNNNKIRYYIAGKDCTNKFKKVIVPKGLFVCFTLLSKKQNEINRLYDYMYDKWLPESGYEEALYYPQLEIYYKDYCEICIAIKKT